MSPLRHKLLRDIRTQRAQFIAVTITIFLGVTMFAASYDSYQNLKASYESTFTDFRFANLTMSGGDVDAFAADARGREGVESVEVRTVVDIPLRVGGLKLLGRVVGLPVDAQPTVNQVRIASGTYPSANEPATVLVEEHMADHFELAPGSTLEILGPGGWQRFVVGGVASSPEYIWPARDRQEVITAPDNFGVAFLAEPSARELAGVTGPTEATVYYTDGSDNEQLSELLLAQAADAGATLSYTRDEQPSNAALSEDLKGFEELAAFFPAMFLAAAAMATYVMISRMVHAQQPHIGVLLANGFTRRQVLRHYLGYGVVPGLAGAIPGAVAGVVLARIITSFYTELLSVPTTLIQFYPATLLGGVLFGLVASLIAAAAPARRAARLAPAEAMRGSAPSGGGRASVPERIAPPLRRLPIPWRMALRGIERNPRRSLFTVLGVVLSLMLVLVSWGMLDTIVRLMDRQFIEIQQEDATVYFTGPVGTSDVRDLQRVTGIAEAEPVLHSPVVLTAGERYETTLVTLDSATAMRRFFNEGGAEISLPDDGLLVGKALRQLIGLSEGDPVQLTIGETTVVARVAGLIDEPLGTLAYASRRYAEEITGVALPATAALINYDPNVEASDVRATLVELESVAAFEDANALYDVVQRYMILFYAFVGVMLAFGGAMAFALIFSAMSVNIAERTREVATLLAVGTERRQISRMITAENMTVALVGIPLGLGAGYLAAREAMASFSSDLFTFDLYIRPGTLAISAVAILGVALMSQWPGLRAIGRLDIARIVKDRSL
ncbi:MAG: FtsX-like permease family protein [Acidimicrobiia bacterium]|nr:FtsX-like permease family protein [Acidimicrobiia bacterium]